MLSSRNHANGWTNDLKQNRRKNNGIQNNLPIVQDRSTIVIMPTSGRSSPPVAKPAIFSELSTISWMEAKLMITDSMTMAIGSNFVRPEKQVQNLTTRSCNVIWNVGSMELQGLQRKKCQKSLSTKLKSELFEHYYIHVHEFTRNDFLCIHGI